jgi:hypothetical protein
MELAAHRDEVTGKWSLEGVEPDTTTFETIIENLKTRKAFKFARYGDGELYCMEGRAGANCDGHAYFTELGKRLKDSVKEQPSYMVGIQPLSVSHLPEVVNKYFCGFEKLYNADVLHSASIEGKLDTFIKALEGRFIILVGPAHLADMFDCVHIVLPNKNCWNYYDHVVSQIGFHIAGIENAVVLLCASMMSEVVIMDFSDYNCTMIDCGSVFDPYAGIKSRKYHYKLNV